MRDSTDHSTDAQTTSAAAVLEEIRERAKVPFDWRTGPNELLARAIAADAATLAAALDEVLKLADEWADTPWPEEGGDRAATATEQIRLDGIHLRAAITRHLTGGTDGH